MERFRQDHKAGAAHQAVLHDYAEGAAWFGVSALPTVIFNERVSLVGAVPEERYRSLLDWILAGKPDGLIPLDRDPPTREGRDGAQSAAPSRLRERVDSRCKFM